MSHSAGAKGTAHFPQNPAFYCLCRRLGSVCREAGLGKQSLQRLFRAVRLVVDTGIHHKRWTREEAIEYMVSNSGTDYVNAVIEIERYIVMPGQATAYKIGELEILRLRELARQQGAAFDIKEFHSAILKNGSVPLKILEELVEEASTAVSQIE